MSAGARGARRKKGGSGAGGATSTARSKTHAAKKKAATFDTPASFLATRPLHLAMTLRGENVMVEVRPLVQTTEVVNYKITIRRGGKVLRWTPTHAELALIGREAGMETKQETSQ